MVILQRLIRYGEKVSDLERVMGSRTQMTGKTRGEEAHVSWRGQACVGKLALINYGL